MKWPLRLDDYTIRWQVQFFLRKWIFRFVKIENHKFCHIPYFYILACLITLLLYFISGRAIGTLIFSPFIVILFMTLNWLDFPILFWCHVIIKPHAAARPYWTILSIFFIIFYDMTSLNCIWIRNMQSAL